MSIATPETEKRRKKRQTSGKLKRKGSVVRKDSRDQANDAPPKAKKTKMNTPEPKIGEGTRIKMTKSGKGVVLGRLIGKGIFGEVYRVDTQGAQTPMKLCLKIQPYTRETKECIDEETRIMDLINANPAASRYLMTHMLTIITTDYHCLMMEEFGKSLLHILSKKTGPFEIECVQEIGFQLLCGIQHLHALGYTHCDIKPSNILIKVDKNNIISVKIADFGNATLTQNMNKWQHSNCVHATWYRPPEVYLGMPQDHKTDIWALGCVLAELYTGDPLFVTDEHCHQLARQHFHLTGIPSFAAAQGEFYGDYFKLDQFTGNPRPYTAEELSRKRLTLTQRPEVREYTAMEQMIPFGYSCKDGNPTLLDVHFIHTLKRMLMPNHWERFEAVSILLTPFFIEKTVSNQFQMPPPAGFRA